MTTEQEKHLHSILVKLEPEFIEKLKYSCCIFITIGTPNENPKWFQYNTFDPEKNIMHFESSQNDKIWFDVDTSKLTENEKMWIDGCFMEVYEYFKSVKYTLLKDKFPTIK